MCALSYLYCEKQPPLFCKIFDIVRQDFDECSNHSLEHWQHECVRAFQVRQNLGGSNPGINAIKITTDFYNV